MEKKFPSFYNLVDEDPFARKYFNKLPSQVKKNIEGNAKNITTFETLKNQAESMMKR